MDDNSTSEHYTDPMSETLLGLAADVLRSFGSAFGGRHLAIVGGAVPSLLVDQIPAGLERHVGTADLDVHLSLHLLDGDTADYYDALIDGLRSLTLEPEKRDGRTNKWSWVGKHRGVHLKVDLLCPARTRGGRPEAPAAGTTAERNIGPAKEITALAVGFGHLVPIDTVTVERVVETSEGRLRYGFPVAGVASWLCLKTDAIMFRNKPKDAYDVVWLVASLGPEQAASSVRSSPINESEYAAELHSQLERLAEQFADAESIGPRQYARFMGDESRMADRRFAIGALGEFWRYLSSPAS